MTCVNLRSVPNGLIWLIMNRIKSGKKNIRQKLLFGVQHERYHYKQIPFSREFREVDGKKTILFRSVSTK